MRLPLSTLALLALVALVQAQLWLGNNGKPYAMKLELELARRLNAERLVVVKSCHVGHTSTLAQLGAAGVLDAGFAGLAAGAEFPIDVIHHSDLARMRALLLGEIQSFAH